MLERSLSAAALIAAEPEEAWLAWCGLNEESERLTKAVKGAVEVQGSEILLRGAVRSWAERHEAEKAAWSAPGVTSVKNYITVRAAA